ncbi:MAG: ComF family protein [Bacteroidia bacterium]
MIDFKSNDTQIVNKWVNKIVPIIQSLNIEFHYVLRALGSKETEATGTRPLDKLGVELEKKLGYSYVPTLIKKNRETTPLHTFRKKYERQDELENVYYMDNDIDLENDKNYLILDDINTTGSTLKTIREVIREKYPNAKVYFFTLGRTGDRDENGEYITTLNSTFDSDFLR